MEVEVVVDLGDLLSLADLWEAAVSVENISDFGVVLVFLSGAVFVQGKEDGV